MKAIGILALAAIAALVLGFGARVHAASETDVGRYDRVVLSVTRSDTDNNVSFAGNLSIAKKAISDDTADNQSRVAPQEQPQADHSNGGYLGQDSTGFPMWTLIALALGSLALVGGGLVTRRAGK